MADEKRMRVVLTRAMRDLFLNNKYRRLDEIAAWLGKPEATIRKEIDPHALSGKMGALDIAEATYYTRDWNFLNAFAAECGAAVYALPGGAVDGTTVHHKLAGMAKEFGELVTQVAEAVADGNVTANEYARCHKEACELIAAVQATLEHLGQLREEQITRLERQLEQARSAAEVRR
jgi:hypothetical protein